MRKWLGIVAAGVVLVATGSIVATPAHADTCGGTLVEYVPIISGNAKIGALQLYYNASNGNNCAMTVKEGPARGVASQTGVTLYINNSNAVRDVGNYAYLAGPVRANGRGKCATAAGFITYGGSKWTYGTQRHCG